MNESQINIVDVINGLESFAPKFTSIEVFAQAVSFEKVGDTTIEFQKVNETNFLCRYNGKTYNIEVFLAENVLRISRSETNSIGAAAIAGTAVGAAIGASKGGKPEHMIYGALLGMLVGAVIGNQIDQDSKRILALKFSPNTRNWSVFQGGLVSWMKDELLVKS